MEIIVSHINADFDAVASMVAVSKLFPSARLGLSGSMNRNVREFLSFYFREVRLVRAREIDLDRIEKLIVVDTQDLSRLGRFSEVAARPRVKKVFFDHHPPSRELANDPNTELHVRRLGSTVTLLVRQLLRQGVSIEPKEATLFCTAVYEDTGCLLYGSTTQADIKAVLDLLRQGADLSVISSYVGRGLNRKQRELLEQLSASTKIHRLRGFEVGIASSSRPDYLEDLDAVVGKLREIHDLAVLFVVVQMGRHSYIIGRSRFAEIHTGKILATLGGGGHSFAGSAVLHDTTEVTACDKLIEILGRDISPQITVQEIMTTPVKTISSTSTIAHARMIMSGFGYGGLPVMDGTTLVGIASRSDMEKAERHGLGHARVTGYMSRDPYVVSPSTPVLDVQHLMIEQNVSSTPVIDDGKLIGIVTAQDVLRCLHKAFSKDRRRREPSKPTNCLEHMRRALSQDRLGLIERVGEISTDLAMNSYLVGGTVRDILLSRVGKDLDIVVEQDAHRLAEAIHARLGGKILLYDRYRTATLNILGIRLDLATTRREFYEFPAARPQVDTQNVRLDLFRRDFTINAMAIGLSRHRFGELFDYYSGYGDLLERKIRVLHNLSFVEDPTRIFRAMRFAGRLEFGLEARTAGFLSEALGSGMLDKLGREVVYSEVTSCLKELEASRVVRLLAENRILSHLSPRLDPSPDVLSRVERAELICHEARPASLSMRDRSFPLFNVLFLETPAKREVSMARFLVPRKYEEWTSSFDADVEVFRKAKADELSGLVGSHYAPARVLAIAAYLDDETARRVIEILVQGAARRRRMIS